MFEHDPEADTVTMDTDKFVNLCKSLVAEGARADKAEGKLPPEMVAEDAAIARAIRFPDGERVGGRHVNMTGDDRREQMFPHAGRIA